MENIRPAYSLKEPFSLFGIGLCLILLSPIPRIFPYLKTFMHPWRAEFTASLLFLAVLIFLFYKHHRGKSQLFSLSAQEKNFIVLPMIIFIFWSGLSIFWASSWKSVVYHTSIWGQYLIFYLIVRQILEKKGGFQALITPLSIILLVIALPSVIEYFSYLVFGGTTTLGMRYAKYGELFNTICPFLSVLVLRLKGKQFLFGLLFVILMWLFIISTLGRTNLILFAAGLVVITTAVFVFRRFHKYRLKIALLALAMIVVPIPLHLISFFNEKPVVPIIKRLSDDVGISYSSDVRKLLKTVSLEMYKTNAIYGVGAGNFGFQFNKYRATYAEKNQQDVNLMTAESEIAERSHNEYLQILAELGTIGGIIFLWFLVGVGLMAFNAVKDFHRLSLFKIAALLGITFFLASSLVSSFSFRLVQNGFIFFFVLAIASKLLLTSKGSEKSSDKIWISPARLKAVYAAGIITCLFLLTNCLIRISSPFYAQKAYAEKNIERAMPFYEMAFWLDSENPTPHLALGIKLLQEQRYSEAIPQLRQVIDKQRGTSENYSYLAAVQSLAGDNEAAEKTFAEALRLYPLSTFVRTRYSVLLEENGKTKESDVHFRIASQIDKKAATTWRTIMTKGSRIATLEADRNSYTALMDLNPLPAMYAIVMEREIKHPEEKIQINIFEN